ncbi:MAG: hypothetical protein GY911_13920, partial [Actinomycetales bacterium]|nr:hypothetical protein [Actinomycetales bacterium]
VADTDTDGDGTPDCLDSCPDDPNKTEPGACGCGESDTDSDGDGIADCNDACPNWPYDCSDDGETLTVPAGGSVADAIDQVSDGGTVRLESGNFPGPIDFGTKNFTLEGDASDPSSVVIDGSGLGTSVLRISGGQSASTVIRGLTIVGGGVGVFVPEQGEFVGGGAFIENSSPRFENVVFSGNQSGLGGAAYFGGSQSVLSSCRFESNLATEDGGGLFVSESSCVLDGVVFESNTAGDQGGGLMVSLGETTVSNCTMTGNDAMEGGGLYWYADESSTPLVVDGCLVTGNLAIDSGGGIKTREGGLVPYPGIGLSNTTVCSNDPDDLVGEFNDLGGNTVCPNVDCNLNGIEDATDIAEGTSTDC